MFSVIEKSEHRQGVGYANDPLWEKSEKIFEIFFLIDLEDPGFLRKFFEIIFQPRSMSLPVC
jgi:hypothetical protein